MVHLDNRRYTRAEVGLAVSDTPTGPFAYMGSQRPGSHDSRDFTAFQDKDGRAYLFCSSDWNSTMRVWELDKTYTKLTGGGKEILIDQAREAPALWHSGEKYFLFSSGCTGWSPNTMLYAESSAIFGSWRLIDDPCRGPAHDRPSVRRVPPSLPQTVSLTFCWITGARTICAVPATRFCPSPLKTACLL